ncbi:MAG: GH25 family lysozyme [bacterium]
MKVLVSVILAFSLAACGSGRHTVATPSRPVAAAPVRVIAPQFGDLKPHPAIGDRPLRYAVHGVDLSRYQSGIDWQLARGSGVNFVFIKATEGGDGFDPLFPSHWTHSAEAGVKRGAYHLFYHCRPAIEQARWFIAHVPRDPTALPPVLDMEWTPTSPTCRIRRPAAEIRAEARIFLAAVTRHYGQRPILYSTPDFFTDNDLGQLSGVTFWLRSVAAPVGEVYPRQGWSFWQYSGTGTVPGIPGKVDLNVFGGSAQDWARFVQ